MSREPLLPPERQPPVPPKMCLAHVVLGQLPGRGMLRAGSASHPSGCIYHSLPPRWAHTRSEWALWELQSFRSRLAREELFVESFQVPQSFLVVGLHYRRDHLPEPGATLISIPRKKLPLYPQQAVLSRIPLFRDHSEGKVHFFSWIFKCQWSTAAEGS